MVISFIDLFRTRNGKFKQFVQITIRMLAEIDEKYKILDEARRRQIDRVFKEIQETIFKDYPPRSNDELSDELVIKPNWMLRPFLSPVSVIHQEIKRLIILLREIEKNFWTETQLMQSEMN